MAGRPPLAARVFRSQPPPKASSSTRARASRMNCLPPALTRRGSNPAHCSSVRSRSDETPTVARSRTNRCTLTGTSAIWLSSLRHCSAYWISSRSPRGRQQISIRSCPGPGSAHAAANSPAAGPPARRQPLWWVWQNSDVRIAHRSQYGTRQVPGGGDGGEYFTDARHAPVSGRPARDHCMWCIRHRPRPAGQKLHPGISQASSGRCPYHSGLADAVNAARSGLPA
jgi:hypothetical protein